MADGEKKFPLMLIVGMIVAGLALAGGVSYYIATNIVAEKADKKAQREPGVFMKLGDAKEGIILNIGGVNSGRYLKIGIILELKPDKKSAPKEGKMPSPEEIKILDATIQFLRSQKVEDYDAQKHEQMKEMLKNEINKALGEERVYQVYITHFVLQ
ncbi:MAG: flagellar basal body-associated FliL family protein [Negativicutes bacterium]|nr:flagellar basal body-associated FliL family protein [Negativicutes bacterium]